jgi:hypothetical protein
MGLKSSTYWREKGGLKAVVDVHDRLAEKPGFFPIRVEQRARLCSDLSSQKPGFWVAGEFWLWRRQSGCYRWSSIA